MHLSGWEEYQYQTATSEEDLDLNRTCLWERSDLGSDRSHEDQAGDTDSVPTVVCQWRRCASMNPYHTTRVASICTVVRSLYLDDVGKLKCCAE